MMHVKHALIYNSCGTHTPTKRCSHIDEHRLTLQLCELPHSLPTTLQVNVSSAGFSVRMSAMLQRLRTRAPRHPHTHTHFKLHLNIHKETYTHTVVQYLNISNTLELSNSRLTHFFFFFFWNFPLKLQLFWRVWVLLLWELGKVFICVISSLKPSSFFE